MTQRRAKYNAVLTEYDGIAFDSKAEATRYGELLLLQKAGEIMHLRTQPKYMLQAPFTDNSGAKIRGIIYVGDFEYVEEPDAQMVVEDVKGVETAVFKLKAKMFKRLYPEYDFRIVPAKDVR